MQRMPDSNLHKLSARGQSVWIDYLSRDLLESGELKRMMRDDSVVGVTSNPTIFQKAISQGTAYDEQLKEVLEENAQDGYVSWEVDPTLAYDREATFDEAMRLHGWIDKPNLYVKIPATKPGLGAIGDCLAGKGAWPQRCLWASTSTKNPEYRDVLYVEELIGPDTVDTMPEETIRAFQDHGVVRGDTVDQGVGEAHALFEQIAKVGVDYDDVTLTLELEGVQKFADSFAELLEGVRAKRGELAAASRVSERA